MKTISSKNSLIVWKHNKNLSNIEVSVFDGNILFMKQYYASLFKDMSEILKTKKLVSFVVEWSKLCDKYVAVIKNDIQDILKSKNIEATDGDITRVSDKFRGNVGEMLIEMLVENGVCSICKPGTYEPVDPDNEQYIDAEAIKDGLPIGIQIKNYSFKNNIRREVLTKAAAMAGLWVFRDKKVSDEKILEFTKTPCQYVIATCPLSNDMLEADYKSVLVFLGPKWLDSLKIQGNNKSGESSKWRMFLEVAEEIEKFN